MTYEDLGVSDDDLVWLIADCLEQDYSLVAGPLDNANSLRSTYAGLVWETRWGFVGESRWIDELVREWETSTVEFKRELSTRTADEKAELIKDLIGLANTKASGRRWLIIGFDDTIRVYHGPPATKIRQDHFEHLVDRYTIPRLSVRYEVVDYRAGKVGKLEVLRDPTCLPYRVAMSVGGQRKRITEGQIFVRHGSQTVQPDAAELTALENEAERAVSLA